MQDLEFALSNHICSKLITYAQISP